MVLKSQFHCNSLVWWFRNSNGSCQCTGWLQSNLRLNWTFEINQSDYGGMLFRVRTCLVDGPSAVSKKLDITATLVYVTTVPNCRWMEPFILNTHKHSVNKWISRVPTTITLTVFIEDKLCENLRRRIIFNPSVPTKSKIPIQKATNVKSNWSFE